MAVRVVIALSILAVIVNAKGIPDPCNRHAPTCGQCNAKTLCFYNAEANECQSDIRVGLTDKTNVINNAYDCPASTPPSFPYTDDFGRNRAYLFSAASNGENQAQIQKCLDHVSAQFYSQYTIPCDWLKQNCSGYLAVNPNEKAIVLTFRGSKGTPQFVLEALDLLTYISRTSHLVDGEVFIYFADALERLWAAGIEKDLLTLREQYPDYELWVFGHSLGGSLASLASVAAVKAGIFDRAQVKSVTMGQPRTGNLQYAVAHDLYVPNSYRIVHATDLITQLPFKLFPGQANAYHHRFNVWYNNDMSGPNFVINERADECVNQQLNLKDTSHLTYFNEDIDNYYLLKC